MSLFTSIFRFFLHTQYFAFAVVECVPPPLPANSHVTNTIPATYVYQDTVTYDCDVGYELSGGDTIRTCTETSYWNNVEPNCTSKYSKRLHGLLHLTYVLMEVLPKQIFLLYVLAFKIANTATSI